MSEYSELRAVALEAARIAARILREGLGQVRQIDYKGRVDIVTDVDRRSEEAVVAFLARETPEIGIVGEEGTERLPPGATRRWYVDPLDGTTNYAHGLPIFAASVGVAELDVPVAGAVVAPALNETFVGARGGGATLNGEPIRVSTTDELVRSLLVTGFPYDPTPENDNIPHFANFTRHARAVRRLGSAAIDLCWVAAGRFDGYWEHGLNAWDMAAGAVIALEAGGRLSDLEGNPFCLLDRQIVASNGRIHDAMVAILRQELERRRRTPS